MDKIQPMEPISSKIIPLGTEWIYQVKWDGIRGICYLTNKEYHIFTKKGFERTTFFPELKEIQSIFKGKKAILDGEVIVLDEKGRPNFQSILYRERGKKNVSYYQRKYPVKYILFDILQLEDHDLRSLPLEERYDLLKTHLQKSPTITLTDNFVDGEGLYDLMRKRNFEGIVAKRKTSTYVSGKLHQDWYKVKISKKILTVIGGLKYKLGYPVSLLVGIFQEEKLFYIGSVSIGLTEEDKRLLNQYKDKLSNLESPFSNLKTEKDVVFIRPVMTCWIRFMEWTNDGGIRHPKIIGFSTMKPEEANGREYSEDDQVNN